MFDFVPESVYGGGEVLDVFLWLVKKKQGKAQGAAGPHSGEGTDGFYRLG